MFSRVLGWRWVSGALIALGACVLLLHWLSKPDPQAPPATTASSAATSCVSAEIVSVLPPGSDEAGAVGHHRRSVHSATGLEEPWRAPSQQGSDPDGEIRFDEQGRLISDRGLRRRFDDLLTAIGEADLDTLRDRFARQMIAELGPQRAEAVLRELDLYIDYLRAVDGLAPGPDWSLAQRMQHLSDLQQSVLGSERAEAWFGEENRYVQQTLRRMAGEADDSQLDEVSIERAAALAESTEHHFAVEQSRQFEQLDVSAEQRFEERSALFNEQAAQRLAELDQVRASWGSRLQRYQQQRAALLAQQDQAASPAQEQALQDLLQAHFDEAEQRRVQALQEAGALPDTSG